LERALGSRQMPRLIADIDRTVQDSKWRPPVFPALIPAISDHKHRTKPY
jgi:hypothetical protein